MANIYPPTGSILTNKDGSNRTGVALSTNILIKVANDTVGAIKSINIDEGREIAFITEVGTDGRIDSAPRSAAHVSGQCTRTRFDQTRISEAFGRGFVHVKSQRVPFDFIIIDQWSGTNTSAIITTIKNVWIKSIGYTYSDDNYIITENMGWEAEDIYSTLGPGGGNVATGGSRNRPIAINAIEQETDRGLRRGSLDAPGLLTDVLSII